MNGGGFKKVLPNRIQQGIIIINNTNSATPTNNAISNNNNINNVANTTNNNISNNAQQTASMPNITITQSQSNEDEKEQILKRCYEKFIDFGMEEQQRIINILQPQQHIPAKEKDQIYDIINYLIEKDKNVLLPSNSNNINNMNSTISRQKIQLIAAQPKYEMIMRIFESKFGQMTKSKEEMIKFCMRKAFKFVYDKIVTDKKQKLNKKEQKQLKNEYFGITNESEYALPFRDDSAEKTMNDDFLKKTFALKNFINDYKLFLESYDDILEKDNQKKINILVEQIMEITDANFEQGLMKIKRIPWSREILEQTKQLAAYLLQKYGTMNESSFNQSSQNKNNILFNESEFNPINNNNNNNNNNLSFTDNLCNTNNINNNSISMMNNQDYSNSQLNPSSLMNKPKQTFISFDEFKILLFNVSKNSNFKDMVTLLLSNFIKTESTNNNSSIEMNMDYQNKNENMNQNENNNFIVDNVKLEGQESNGFNNIIENKPYKKIHTDDIKIDQNQQHIMESPDHSINHKDKLKQELETENENTNKNSINRNTKNSTIINNKQIKEEEQQLESGTIIKKRQTQQQDYTPDIQSSLRTTQFTISPHLQNTMNKSNNNNNNSIINQNNNNSIVNNKISTLTNLPTINNIDLIQEQTNIQPNPFSLVNLSNHLQGIFNTNNQPQQQMQQTQLPIQKGKQGISQFIQNSNNNNLLEQLPIYKQQQQQNNNLIWNEQNNHNSINNNNNNQINDKNNYISSMFNLFNLDSLINPSNQSSQQQPQQPQQQQINNLYPQTNQTILGQFPQQQKQPINNQHQIDADNLDNPFLKLFMQCQDFLKQNSQQSQQQNILSFQNAQNNYTNQTTSSILPLNNNNNSSSNNNNQQQQMLLTDFNNSYIQSINPFQINNEIKTSSQPLQTNNNNKNNNNNNNLLQNECFQNVFNEININLMKNNLTSSNGIIQPFSINPQFYLPLTESQINIMKQQQNIIHDEMYKETQRSDQQDITQKKK